MSMEARAIKKKGEHRKVSYKKRKGEQRTKVTTNRRERKEAEEKWQETETKVRRRENDKRRGR